MTDTLFTVPPKLSERQQRVYDLTEHGVVDAGQAGIAWHVTQDCWFCKHARPCDWADTTGREILESLRKKGLVRRDRHWVYRRVGGAGGSQGDFPEGF